MELERAKVPIEYGEVLSDGSVMITDTAEDRTAESVEGAKVISFPHNNAAGKVYLFSKRCFDLLLSMVCLVLLAPVFLVIAAAVRHEDGGPVIHRRRCISARGTYDMLKFRTMVTDADNLGKYLTPEQIAEYHTNIKLRDDPRITKVGRFLRKTSLDELPQLLNILRGEMSFVGPRPVVREELEQYGRDSGLLLSAKPGITGYWQVYGRSDSTYESGERQRLELYYIGHRNLRLDAVILFKTVPAVLSTRGSY